MLALRPERDEIVCDNMQLSVGAVRAWAKGTDRELVYARVADRPADALRNEARDLYARGIATPLSHRINGGWSFLLQRRGKARLAPTLGLKAKPTAPIALAEGDELGRSLLRYLTKLAERGGVCPDDQRLAEILGLDLRTQAAHVMRRLRDRRHIGWEPAPIGRPRVIRIAATGKTTGAA